MSKKYIIVSSFLLLISNHLLGQDFNNKLENDTTNANQFDISDDAFAFTEIQLGEDDNSSRNTIVLGYSNNVFLSNAGYTFGAVSYRFRAYGSNYNSVYINNIPMNDNETGQFRFSLIGGINNITKNSEYALPFESNNFCMPTLAGSSNYNFRPSQVPNGHKISLSGANRNYTGRVMYTFGSGMMNNGWALAGSATVRYSDINGFANVEGTFYNSVSYYLGAEKIINNKNNISIVTFGNPTKRGSRGATTDEVYWLADSHYYNPYLGYYNGERRNSRIINDFCPTAIVTWDYKYSENFKISTSIFGQYSMYSTTKLNYNQVSNPAPDYWKNLPSSQFNVWDESDINNRTDINLDNWNDALDYWSKEQNRYINWDGLYYANTQNNITGNDALYYQQQNHTDRIRYGGASNFRYTLNNFSYLTGGIDFTYSCNKHYVTMYDLLGANNFHNINSYALSNFSKQSSEIQYDMLNPNAKVEKGDTFLYNYNISAEKGGAWVGYTINKGMVHAFATGKISYSDAHRQGKMQNGLAPQNSFGKSKTAKFLDGGVKLGSSLNFGGGHVAIIGLGYEYNSPNPNSIFVSPEVNNDFVTDVKCSPIMSAEIGYSYSNAKIHANINAFYTDIKDINEWTCFYSDNENSFAYVSMTGIEKQYYGIDGGIKFKVNSEFSVTLLGAINDAKYVTNADVISMKSTDATYSKDVCMTKGMRESGTPMGVASLGLEYNTNGWFLDLKGNYYDRIYLSFAPLTRYQTSLKLEGNVWSDGSYDVPQQARGEGGFMLDGSIGKYQRLKRGSIYVGLMVTNILNNNNICTGGYEFARTSYALQSDGSTNERTYKFAKSPKKYYAWNINGMLNIVYKF